eukprot:COSAG05_NODE_1135_length_5760_cov_9.624448_2_plen_100_part_00
MEVAVVETYQRRLRNATMFLLKYCEWAILTHTRRTLTETSFRPALVGPFGSMQSPLTAKRRESSCSACFSSSAPSSVISKAKCPGSCDTGEAVLVAAVK